MSKRLSFFLITLIALILCPAIRAGVKYVAVVETDIDAASGASSEMTSAEVRLITAELRREAVKNLPHDRYNVMTSETVMAQGSAKLEECAEENCVIALGSKIGADFIVRGTISKFQTLFTLTVDIFETNDGNLVASSDPVRSENIRGLLENAAPICAAMYKAFVNMQNSVAIPTPTAVPLPALTPKKPVKKSFWLALGLDAVGAGLLAYGIYENGVAKDIVNGDEAYKNKPDYEIAKQAGTARNIGYALGSVLLAGGVSIHILF